MANDDDAQGSSVENDSRPIKRRKTSVDESAEHEQQHSTSEQEDVAADTIINGQNFLEHVDLPRPAPSIAATTDGAIEMSFTTPRSKTSRLSGLQPATSPLSSPPPEEFIIPPSAFRSQHKRLKDVSFPLSSSPLSSPPPILFDPFISAESSDDGRSSRRSSTSPSEVDEMELSSNPFSSSQNSTSGRNALPNMKGKDLFDAQIWADPVRTSVFYTFATSLRQKIKDAEPTSSHRFISHLRDRGKLVRCYTQNIDQIEEKVGLSTRLLDGPGSKGRFSRRSTANTSQLDKMVEEASAEPCDKKIGTEPESSSQVETSAESSQQSTTPTQSDENTTATTDAETSSAEQAKVVRKPSKREPPRPGVECVFLHGSLELLRCFLCGRVCSWDDDERETETLSGQQPECPHCVGATVAREERGKRALGVGKLRPDIVLYGEEHPNSHLISPIVTHDLSLYPDMMLILGTSLRVHGLKVMVREFAKAVHSNGGKVVFVNFTKPPESSWGEVIDYWVQWDCDAWVRDLEFRIPKLWQEPEAPKPRKKRESSGMSEDSAKDEKQKKLKPPAANPVALRDTKVTGAYWTSKVLTELHRITGVEDAEPPRRASISTATVAAITELASSPREKAAKAKSKRPRKSAPGALEKTARPSSTLNPNHGRSRKKSDTQPAPQETPATPQTPVTADTSANSSSILSSVKTNPRFRKRKVIDGEEVPAPGSGGRRRGGKATKAKKDELKLPPMILPPVADPKPLFGRPQPLEPKSPPSGPLASLSPNLRSAKTFEKNNAFYIDDSLVRYLDCAPYWSPTWTRSENRLPLQPPHLVSKDGAGAALALPGLRTVSPLLTKAMPQRQARKNLEGQLMDWGSSWSCKR